jgi:hypothetical protein
MSPRDLRFDPRQVSVGFMVDEVTVEKSFSMYFGFPLSISFNPFFIVIFNSCH